MRTAYFDCFSGVSGDMALGALIDAGLDFPAWKAELAKLGVTGYAVTKKSVRDGALKGTSVTVDVRDDQPGRGYSDIKRLIADSELSSTVREKATKVFRRLAEAESRAHGVPVAKVHFHEVGAVDSIVDIVGTCLALKMLGVEKVVSSALNLGSGAVHFSHGTYPVPAPATAELIKGFPVYASDSGFEMTTPTGAALLTTLASSFGPMPQMTVGAIGHGFGKKKGAGRVNALRVFIGDTPAVGEEDEAVVIETNIDDMDPRLYEPVMERLFGAGALDVWLTPIIMKKSRPAVKLSVLCEAGVVDGISMIILKETTTFGVRVSNVRRQKLAREFREVKTPYGSARVKLGLFEGNIIKAVPEYEDAKALADKAGKPVAEMVGEIERLYLKG